MRPPDKAAMRSATRSADMPGPGNRFGQDVTIRQRTDCAWATFGIATAPAARAPPPTSFRRDSLLMMVPKISARQVRAPLEGVEVMDRAMAMADVEAVGRSDRRTDIG